MFKTKLATLRNRKFTPIDSPNPILQMHTIPNPTIAVQPRIIVPDLTEAIEEVSPPKPNLPPDDVQTFDKPIPLTYTNEVMPPCPSANEIDEHNSSGRSVIPFLRRSQHSSRPPRKLSPQLHGKRHK